MYMYDCFKLSIDFAGIDRELLNIILKMIRKKEI